jgi:hypothetical protein
MSQSTQPHQATLPPVQPLLVESKSTEIQISRIRQDDFLAQLTQALAAYDTDGDGLLSDDDWQRVADDLRQTA